VVALARGWLIMRRIFIDLSGLLGSTNCNDLSFYNFTKVNATAENPFVPINTPFLRHHRQQHGAQSSLLSLALPLCSLQKHFQFWSRAGRCSANLGAMMPDFVPVPLPVHCFCGFHRREILQIWICLAQPHFTCQARQAINKISIGKVPSQSGQI
jgi:hypothetical protein